MAVTWWRLLMAAVVVETGGGGGGSNCEVSPAQVEKAAGALCPLRLYLPNLVSGHVQRLKNDTEQSYLRNRGFSAKVWPIQLHAIDTIQK